ncbi:YpoC family protein [Pseudalkalibacillus hwajinpoensis]|uniref:YpoC family protein n=1 Tax=Guptibacillus hwajinpoensis TaxID=208199 RepID=UPI00325C319F
MNGRSIPLELKHPLFFIENDWTFELKEKEERLPFYYEMQANCEELDIAPWDDPAEFMMNYFNGWEKVDDALAELFASRRKSKAKIEMIFQIGYFLEALFWMNDKRACPGVWEERYDDLPITPVNGKERIKYLLDKPDHYIAFIQLRKLIEEMHKKWEVSKITR